MLKTTFAICFILSALLSCSTSKVANNNSSKDPYSWLEEIESPRSLEFARAENEKTFAVLKSDPNFPVMESEIRKIAYAKDRIAWGSADRHKIYYNFWTDEKNSL